MTTISVRLSEATIGFLRNQGEPEDIVARLVDWAASRSRRSSARARQKTDDSLRGERRSADARMATSSEHGEQCSSRADACERERAATDRYLDEERADMELLHGDQREANTQMIVTTIRAQEVRDEADSAKRRAEKNEQELRTVAEFREMFIGILGHDLRTPLGSICMSAEILMRGGNLDERQTDVVARIARSADRIGRMIAQLLDLTRSRLGGGMPIEREHVDLRAICEHVLAEFHAPIQFEARGDLTGNWDADRLEEVFSNLTGNAIEFAAEGTVVNVFARSDEEGVVVDVVNLGEPIPLDILPSIFEPFRRAKQVEVSKAGNLGLGLYIAHQIVIAHGGTLTALSEHGRTTFTVRLPRGTLDERR